MDWAMAEGSDDESDGQDDAIFTGDHEKYVQEVQRRQAELLRLEEERQNVPTFHPRKMLT
jgi:hypothetical protein